MTQEKYQRTKFLDTDLDEQVDQIVDHTENDFEDSFKEDLIRGAANDLSPQKNLGNQQGKNTNILKIRRINPF